MKFLCQVFTLLLICFTTTASAQEVLSLEDAVKTALQNNPQITIARETAIQSRADFAEANSSKFPTLSISGNLAAQGEQAVQTGPLLESLPGAAGSFPSEFVLSDAFQAQVALKLEVLLTTFGRIEHRIVASYLQAESDQQNLMTEERRLSFQVKQAYLSHLGASETAEVARINLASSREHQKQTQILLENGLVANFELLKAQQDVTKRETELLDALKEEDLTRASLLTHLHTKKSIPLQLQPLEEVKLEAIELDRLTHLARQQRPEMTVLNTSLKAAQHLLKSAEAEGRPTLSLALTQSHQSGNALAVANQTQAMLVFRIPLFDGGVRKAKVSRAESTLRQLEAQKELLTSNIDLQVEQAWRELKQSQSNVRASESVLTTAIEAQRMAAIRYQNGISTSLEFEDTQRTLASSRKSVVLSRYRQDLAFAQLENALGVDFPERIINQKSLSQDSEKMS